MENAPKIGDRVIKKKNGSRYMVGDSGSVKKVDAAYVSVVFDKDPHFIAEWYGFRNFWLNFDLDGTVIVE